MKPKYRLKGWVVTSVYLFSISAIVLSLFFIGKVLKSAIFEDETLSYVYHDIIEENVVPVINYESEKIILPYNCDTINVIKKFYDKDADSQTQEESLIFYQNTYMPNTGVLYGSDQSFDIVSVLDGTVESIVADEILGNIITIKHSNNLTTIYHSLNEVHVLVGDLLKQGDIIGNSGINKIDATSENMLLFEVELNGEYINPEVFYNMDIKDLS